ncbi:PRC-barrel domain-containing protein [Methylocaldum sp.]|uniref:PRC-barrel domain-containing protein n=1 Tax=Methylocaldum sp. TaxID=1969727 RepID=UPI002D389EED|nr:PRC-barrel domain-containing protein [Methylocaldum sp.]HYE35783.1 PRC-barrel domain-containing protein [Methylocaldum sp.]
MELKLGKTLILSTLCSLALMGDATAQAQEEAAPIAGQSTLGVTVIQHEVIAKGWRASKLINANIYNENDQKIGEIDDFIVAPDGSLSVAIVDVGGFLGMGKRHVAVPVDQFRSTGDKASRIVLPGASKEALKQLPEFKYVQ